MINLFQLKGIAKYPDGTEAEERIDLRIRVVDENDNAPEFPSSRITAKVAEHSPVGQCCKYKKSHTSKLYLFQMGFNWNHRASQA